jgi:hypothetical protein
MLLGAVLLVAAPAGATNLLYNGNFNIAGPAGWNKWTYGPSAFADYKTLPYSYAYDSTPCINAGNWGDWWSSGGGWNQVVAGAPGISYTFSCVSATESWDNMAGEMRLIFLDASSAVIHQDVLNNANYEPNKPWAPYTMTSVAPAGTTQVKVEFATYGARGAMIWDNADLEASVEYPAIANVKPDGAILMQVTNMLSFTATSGAAITNIQVVLNGVDVSANLVITGSSTSKSVTYSGIKTNQAYAGTITVKDANNLSASAPVLFDTFSPTFLWEAEDFDFNGGSYINNPILSSTSQAGSYFGVTGTQDIDENDINHGGASVYRLNDFMATGLAGDTPRQNFLNAQVTDTNIADYAIGYFAAGEWVNYTRSFPSGKYNIYARLANGNTGTSTIYLDKVTGGQGTSTQTTTPLGTFQYTGISWTTYQYVPLTDTYGNLVAVDLNGVTTLRATAGGGNMNFFLIVPARLDVPVIANAYPNVLLAATNKFAFAVTSASATLPTTGIHLSLNGVDVTSALVIGGTSTSRSVSYTGLKTNTAYTAVINVVDANGSPATSTVAFDTYTSLFVWEAEDWDYSNGQYLNNPVPSSTAGANRYFGLVGVQGVDENETGTDPANLYRSGDTMNAGPCTDVPRQKFLDAKVSDPNVQDWNAGYFDSGEWVNYTRSFPAGTYNIYARLANGAGGTATVNLSKVTSGQGTSSQGTVSLGSFQFAAQGWNNYTNVPLRDRFGNYAELTLSGATTLRAIAGAANMNFFMLAAPRNDLPRITDVYPDGTLQLQATNTFRFKASNPTVPIYSTNISLTLNGTDMTSQLTLSGSVNSWNVSLPLALNATRYAAVIRVQDANTNVATTTIYFDTFNPANFTWECEDYDFNSGLFIDNPTPTAGPADNSYFGLGSGADYGVDFYYETSAPATPYTNYNRFSLGIDVCGDYPPLAKYVTARLTDPSVKDYNLAYWTSNSWANYTHTYPAGTYNVYARMASGMGGSVQLDKITGGVTNHLGQFDLPNWGWGVYSWWPLVDANGQLVTVTLGGISTLRATTDGSANANRFMLATPLAAVMPPPITATVDGGSVVLSFPTVSGRLYQVWAKDNVTDATWTLVGTSLGDGSTKTWSESTAQGHRFYRLAVE